MTDSLQFWGYLYDDYERGTAFITDDMEGSQRAVADGLPYDVAKAICIEHNTVVARLLSEDDR